MAASPSAPVAATCDLTARMAPFLDPHLLFPLFIHLKQTGIFSKRDILAAELDATSATSMVDYEKDLYRELHGGQDPPASLDDKANGVLRRWDELEQEIATLKDLIENHAEEVAQLREEGSYTIERLEADYGVRPEHLSSLYEYAKLVFSAGDYNRSFVLLSHYILLDESNSEQSFRAIWGKLVAEILDAMTQASAAETQEHVDSAAGMFASAAADLHYLADEVENAERNIHPLLQLNMRAWLLHWSLFIFLNPQVDGGRDQLVEFFFREKNMNCIQTYCPWLLRYLAVAIVTNKRRWATQAKKDLVWAIRTESYEYSDPITEFVYCLLREFDFNGAQEKLRRCDEVVSADYFIANLRDEFMENARQYIFETYCRIHQKIDIDMLASSLSLKHEDAERWIISLINESRLDAKIDSTANFVEMEKKYPSIYQQIVDKTKDLSYATYVLADGVREYYNECVTQARADMQANQGLQQQQQQQHESAAPPAPAAPASGTQKA